MTDSRAHAGASDPPLRVAFVVLHTSPLDEPGTKDAGGMNVVVIAQAAELARQGHEVELITRRSAPDLPDVVELGSGVTVRHLDAGPPRLLAKGDHEYLIDEFGRALAAHLRTRSFDVIHAEHWFSGIAALPVAREAGIPIVQSFHSIAAEPDSPLTEGERPESPGRLAGEHRLAAEVDLVIAVSNAERDTILGRLQGDPDRVRVVPLGVDTELFRPCEPEECAERREWIDRGGRPEVLVAGRLHPLKGIDLAVSAVAAIPDERRPTLRVIGVPPPDGEDYVRQLHAQITDAGMITTVAFDGALRRQDLAERLRRTNIVLMPSHSETFGLVALEASASGIPVIARATGGLKEAVVDGDTGVLLTGDDPEAWAAEIERLLADEPLRRRMGDAARRHALRHDWRVSAQGLIAAYRGLLGTERVGT